MLKQVHSPSMDGNQSWYFRKQACSYCIKNIPMEISWFFVICDKFWPCFETVRFSKAISHRHKWLKSKIMWNITSNQRENKTVDRIGLLNLSWYQINYSIFVTFRNSVAVQVYQNDVDFLFFFRQWYDTRDYRTEFGQTTFFLFVFSKGRSCRFQIV